MTNVFLGKTETAVFTAEMYFNPKCEHDPAKVAEGYEKLFYGVARCRGNL